MAAVPIEVPTATVAHLSDLHLGKDFYDWGGPPKSAIKSLVTRGGLSMQAHDQFVLTVLPSALRLAARYVNAPEDSFDFHAITGDISTNADTANRFAFAAHYLSGTV